MHSRQLRSPGDRCLTCGSGLSCQPLKIIKHWAAAPRAWGTIALFEGRLWLRPQNVALQHWNRASERENRWLVSTSIEYFISECSWQAVAVQTDDGHTRQVTLRLVHFSSGPEMVGAHFLRVIWQHSRDEMSASMGSKTIVWSWWVGGVIKARTDVTDVRKQVRLVCTCDGECVVTTWL